MDAQQKMMVFFGVLAVIGVISIYYFYVVPFRKLRQRVLELEQEYQEALKSGDKQRALKVGREYYSTMRDGELTVYDEQAIANDLSTMK